MTNILGGVSAVLFLLLLGLGYSYKGLQSELAASQAEVQIKEQSINALKDSIKHQNEAVEAIKVDTVKKEIVYKDRIQYITKTIEVEKEVIKELKGSEDCNATKGIMDEMFN